MLNEPALIRDPCGRPPACWPAGPLGAGPRVHLSRSGSTTSTVSRASSSPTATSGRRSTVARPAAGHRTTPSRVRPRTALTHSGVQSVGEGYLAHPPDTVSAVPRDGLDLPSHPSHAPLLALWKALCESGEGEHGGVPRHLRAARPKSNTYARFAAESASGSAHYSRDLFLIAPSFHSHQIKHASQTFSLPCLKTRTLPFRGESVRETQRHGVERRRCSLCDELWPENCSPAPSGSRLARGPMARPHNAQSRTGRAALVSRDNAALTTALPHLS